MRQMVLVVCVCWLIGVLPVWAQASAEPVPLIDEGEYDILNVVLIGAATRTNSSNPGLTDAILIVSFNRDTGHAAIVSIPRDLHVYIPGIGFKKINQAYLYGETRDDEHTGAELLKMTIQHNLGLVIDHYIRVDFDSFGQLVDSVDGVMMTVDCAIEDWRLKEPDLDKDDADNWEMFTLPAGRHFMDGDMALWYVRSRRTSSDLDRGRRQQDMLRAIWRKVNYLGLLEQFPSLWQQLMTMTQTDMPFSVAMQLLPTIIEMDTADLSYYTLRLRHEVNNGYSNEGRYILVPDQANLRRLMQEVVLPPTDSQIGSTRPTIAVVNASGIKGMDYVAAHRLELEGFRTMILNEWEYPRQYNKIIDYTGVTKGNPIDRIQDVLSVTDEGVEITPLADREYDYRVIVGHTYPSYSCTRPVMQPEIETASSE